MEGEIWMRRRQKPEKRRFYKFEKHITKVNRITGVETEGWLVKVSQVSSNYVEENFIKDMDIKPFKDKSRHVKIEEEEVARMLLTGEINVGIL